jgi:hypothetical protein
LRQWLASSWEKPRAGGQYGTAAGGKKAALLDFSQTKGEPRALALSAIAGLFGHSDGSELGLGRGRMKPWPLVMPQSIRGAPPNNLPACCLTVQSNGAMAINYSQPIDSQSSETAKMCAISVR